MHAGTIYFYPSPEQAKNEAVLGGLMELSKKCEVKVVPEGHLLADYLELPCIQVEDGESIQGVESIREFAEKRLSA